MCRISIPPVIGAAALLMAACSSTAAPPATSPPALQSPAVATGTATVSASTAAGGGLDRCPPARPLATLPILARPPLRPDDLAVASEGGLWVSDPDGGHLARVDAGGHQVTRVEDPRGLL